MFIPLKDENPAFRPPIVTLVLIGVNVLLFALHALRPQGLEMAALRFGAVPYDITHFGSAAAGRVPPLLTLLTSMFQHGSVFHLGGNMLFLWIFGNNVEDFLGHARYALFYAICGLAAALTQVAAMPGSRAPMIGASGAIAGVLGAYWLLFPRARVKTFIFRSLTSMMWPSRPASCRGQSCFNPERRMVAAWLVSHKRRFLAGLIFLDGGAEKGPQTHGS